MIPDEPTRSAFHLYVTGLPDTAARQRKEIVEHLHQAGIGVNVHYIPVHTQPYYQNLGFRKGDFPEAEKYYQSALTLPLFPTMTESEQDYIVKTLLEVLPS